MDSSPSATPQGGTSPPTSNSKASASSWTRREIVQLLTGAGLAVACGSVFTRALAQEAAKGDRLTAEMIASAQWVAGLTLSDEQQQQAASALERLQRRLDATRSIELDAGEAPITAFFPQPPTDVVPVAKRSELGTVENTVARPERPATDEELAFCTVGQLGKLLRNGDVTAVQLAQLYLARLKKHDATLHCVVNLTESLAMEQAQRADRELKSGVDRGPLHGIPWGAKDLISYPGYPTTWGAEPFRDQVRKETATVAKRLDDAGAVLVAKLSLGALAWGDRWFGGMTRNPWSPEQGSSGSSAGSASATAAGLVGFSLGSETLGSIVSPCRRCGVTGLRPTFGRVSRYGCMPLSWTMDKIGPICRSAADCALVLGAIHGADGLDDTAVNYRFQWPGSKPMKSMKIGYVPNGKSLDERVELATLKDLGATLVEIQLPDEPPAMALHPVLNVEAASVFESLTRENVEEGLFRWPGAFREGHFTSAVDYVRALRLRRRLINAMNAMFDEQELDAYVEGDDLVITNMTGHPSVVLRREFDARYATPRMFTITGRLYEETNLLAIANAYEMATGHFRRAPKLD